MPDQDKLINAIDAYADAAYGSERNGELERQRSLAIDAYAGLNIEPADEGRSQVVDWTVFETIQWILPSLLRIFANGDNIVEFDPTGPEDEQVAEQESDYLNYLVTQKNNWFMTCLTWFQDALLTKNAYCMAFIEEKLTTEKESYKGQSEQALSLLLDDDVEVVEGSSYPDPDDTEHLIDPQSGQEIPPEQAQQAMQAMMMQGIQPVVQPPRNLYDVTVKRTKPLKRLRFRVLPPERCLVGVDTPDFTTADCDYFEYFEYVPLSELRSQGFDISDDIGSDNSSDSEEDNSRDTVLSNEAYRYGNSPDPSMKIVKARTIWLRYDYDEDGIAELQKVVRVGNEILIREDAARIPVASIVPFINTHRHMGNSVADLVFDIQRIKTALLRGGLDSLYLSLNPERAISEKVNLDDMLVSRPGGVKRLKDGAIPGEGHIQDLIVPFVFPQAQEGLMAMDAAVEARVGVNRIFQGIDSSNVNDHDRIGQLSTMAAQRVELIARLFANGVEYLFSLAHELIIKSGHQAETIKLRGQWVDIDPSQWRTGRDMRVVAPFAAGNKDTLVARLLTIAQLQEKALAGGLPIVTADDAYNTAIELTKASDFPAPEKFWTDPSQIPPKPEPPDYTLLALQVEDKKATNQGEDSVRDADVNKYKADLQAEVDKYVADLNARVEEYKIQVNANLQMALAKDKEGSSLELEKVKANLKFNLSENEGRKAGETKAINTGQNSLDQVHKTLELTRQQLSEMAESANAPREIIRDKSGKVTGVRVNGKVRPVKRDASDKVSGI